MNEPSSAIPAELARRFDVVETEVQLGDETFTVLRPRSAEDLISEDDFARDERLPYWADVWPSSIILAERLLELKGDGSTALELGCGVGLSTLAATSSGFNVLSTDYYEDALDVTRANVFRNLGKIARTRHVDWRHLPEDLGAYDVVFASDVLYEKEYAELLPVILNRILAVDGMALIADPGRVAAPIFVESCIPNGLVIEEKRTWPFHAGEIRQQIDIYRIRRRRLNT